MARLPFDAKEGTVSIMETNRAAWFAGVGLCLGLAGAVRADEPAAMILPPEPGAVSSAPAILPSVSLSNLTPSEPAPPVVVPRKRDPNFQYPPPYNKGVSDPLNIGGLWHWLTGSDKAGADKKIDPVPSGAPTAGQTRVAHVGPQPPPTAVAAAPAGQTPTNPIQAPAWRWYGYGAPVPGSNPYAPDGVYGAVHPLYYYQTGATPAQFRSS